MANFDPLNNTIDGVPLSTIHSGKEVPMAGPLNFLKREAEEVARTKQAQDAVDRMQDYATQAGFPPTTPPPSIYGHWDGIAVHGAACDPRCASCSHAASEASGEKAPYVLVTPAYLSDLVEQTTRLTRELAEERQRVALLREELMRALTTGEKPHMIQVRMR